MRRTTLLLCLLAACVPALAAAASASRPPAAAKVTECVVVDDGEMGRSATFRGEMTAVPGTARMQMRFTVLRRAKGGRMTPVDAPGLGAWRRSKPGVRTFAYDQRVVGLRSGNTYRALVSFRWVGADGKAVARAGRRTGPCRQPGELPNLTVADIASTPGPRAATVTYRVDVSNPGRSAARKVRVALRVDGALVDSSDIGAIAPGGTASVYFTGPQCTAEVRAVADPQGSIRESNEGDNALTEPCPL